MEEGVQRAGKFIEGGYSPDLMEFRAGVRGCGCSSTDRRRATARQGGDARLQGQRTACLRDDGGGVSASDSGNRVPAA